MENKSSILVALEEYIRNLHDFKTLLEEDNNKAVFRTMKEINRIRKFSVH